MNPADQIDKVAAGLSGWKREMYSRLREWIGEADPDLEEDWKWDSAVWRKKGNVVALGVFKEHLKVNFFKGAMLPDPRGLFNAGLDAKQTRLIDLRARARSWTRPRSRSWWGRRRSIGNRARRAAAARRRSVVLRSSLRDAPSLRCVAPEDEREGDLLGSQDEQGAEAEVLSW
jgi:hypothetical protein